MAIETSIGLDFEFNSPTEIFYYDMTSAFVKHGIDPITFRKISTSDWMIIKNVKSSMDEKYEVYMENERINAKIKAEMQKRLQS